MEIRYLSNLKPEHTTGASGAANVDSYQMSVRCVARTWVLRRLKMFLTRFGWHERHSERRELTNSYFSRLKTFFSRGYFEGA